MAKFGIGSLKKGLEKAPSLKDIKGTVEKSAGSIKESAQKLPGNIKDVDVSKSMKSLGKKGEEVFVALKDKKSISKDQINEAMTAQDTKKEDISILSALKIIYCLIAADGEINDSEMELFDDIGRDMDSNFTKIKDSVISECNTCIAEAEDKEEYMDDLRLVINTAINEDILNADNTVKRKLLIWNLYSVAYIDNNCSEEEINLIRYTGRSLDIDKAILLEMDEAIKTMIAIDKEMAWIKDRNRPYIVIENQVKELEKRKDIIMKSVYALVSD